MRRKFSDPMMQRTYDDCMKTRPTTVSLGLGQAFFYGYDNPDSKPNSPRCGAAKSIVRAAWAAGVDCRRADNKAAEPAKSASRNVSFVVMERLADRLDAEQSEQAIQALNGIRKDD